MFIDPIFHINESFCILDEVGYGCFSDKHCIAYSMYPSPSLHGVYPNINRMSNRYIKNPADNIISLLLHKK